MDQGPGSDGSGYFSPSARAVRALRIGSAVLVLGVVVPAAVVAGTEEHGPWRSAAALLLAALQVAALWWVVRRPRTVLAVTALTGVGLWLALPAVSLTGALLAAQIALSVLSSQSPPRVSRWWLLGLLALAPGAFAGGGALGLAAYLLAVTLAWTGGQWRRAQHERLVAQTHRAAAEERARIAREVHDVVAHTVSVMVIQASAAEDVFERDPERARQALRAIDGAGRSALSELRLLLRAEPPPDGDDGRRPPRGLTDLEELAANTRASGLVVDLTSGERTRAPAAAVDLAGYRIVQEALTNTLRHARATRVSIRVRYDASTVHLTVTDDGRPPARAVRSPGAGRGLLGMRERVALLGGTLEAGPGTDGGFEVRAKLPIGCGP
ncbi:sensor histidine kinase [Streptomyces dangxiongensis]|uniref:sensor histidine kinase n=1 Tax=Streptomyces dangxiongensis TaxID=1442032 RepID=UPI00196A0E53|nr:histidine kinase [Streptomyces dangxiongensis]